MRVHQLVATAFAALLAGCVDNVAVERELREEPQGDRAQKVMLLTLPSARTIPVNYLREGEVVYAGADGRWWQELTGEGAPVELWIRGEALRGHARAIEDDQEHIDDVFSRLRPVSRWFLFGTLVQVDLASDA